MNPSVVLFFIHNVLATFLLGMKFSRRKDPVVKDFGYGLLLNSAAFAIWSAAAFARPQNLQFFVTLGAVFFIVSLIVFLAAGLQKVDGSNRRTLLMAGSVIALVLFIFRTFNFPSQPGFSPEGYFFFNAHPVVQIIYIFGLGLTVLPAAAALASRFNNSGYGRLIHYGFIAQVMGGIILLTSNNILVLTIDGWIIGLTYLLMWTTLLFNQKAWSGVK
jgi:hypothetical protein